MKTLPLETLISSFSGYGIANDSTSGSESFNISANVPSVSISEAKDYYINVTLSPADRTPAPNTKADLAVGCYLPSGYTCTISSNTPCSLKGADGKGIGYNLWSGGMSYGSGDMDAGQSVTIDVNSEIKCETGSYYTFVVDYIEIGGKKSTATRAVFILKPTAIPAMFGSVTGLSNNNKNPAALLRDFLSTLPRPAWQGHNQYGARFLPDPAQRLFR
ncbi:MAG: hypothetical protein ACLU99_03715 [Alphaproteobacteria bacterium]